LAVYIIEDGIPEYYKQKKISQESTQQVNAQVSTQDTVQVNQHNVVDKQTDTESTPQVNTQVNTQVEILLQCLDKDEKTTIEIANLLKLKDRINVMHNYIQPALKQGFIEMTIPDKPNSRLQKYRLTASGKKLKENL